MLRHLVPLAALAAVALAPGSSASPPADAFCVILIEPSDDFTSVRVTVDEETNLSDRRELWPMVDADRDGSVTPAEREAFRWQQVRYWPQQEGLGVKGLAMHRQHRYDHYDAQKPLYAATWRQVGHTFHQQEYRLPGTLTQPEELETQEVREFGFDVRQLTSRIVLLGGQPEGDWSRLNVTPHVEYDTSVIEYVVVRAPKGWKVESATGESYNGTVTVEPGKRDVDLPAFDTKRPYRVVFYNAKLYADEEKEGPGLTLALGAAALAAGAWVARRRT